MRLEETTFRPFMDKWIARDGTPVVLRASTDEAVILRFADGVWRVSAHVAEDERGGLRTAALRWRGRNYRAEGEELMTFADEDAEAGWSRIYDRLALRTPPKRGRELDLRAGGSSTCACV